MQALTDWDLDAFLTIPLWSKCWQVESGAKHACFRRFWIVLLISDVQNFKTQRGKCKHKQMFKEVHKAIEDGGKSFKH
eukprot:2127424-Amphidinium_carterae.1